MTAARQHQPVRPWPVCAVLDLPRRRAICRSHPSQRVWERVTGVQHSLTLGRSGARGRGARGGARHLWSLSPSSFLGLYQTAHSESTVDKRDNSTVSTKTVGVSKLGRLRPPFCWHATCRGYRTASGNGLLPGAPVLFRLVFHGWRGRVFDLANGDATAHLQAAFAKAVPPQTRTREVRRPVTLILDLYRLLIQLI